MLSICRKLSSSPLSPKLLLPLLYHHHQLTHLNPPLNPSPIAKPFSSHSDPGTANPPLSLLRGGCYPDNPDCDAAVPAAVPAAVSSLPLCPGCGVHMQPSDPSLPGFFSTPSPKSPDYRAPLDRSRPLPLPLAPPSLKSGLLQLPNPDLDSTDGSDGHQGASAAAPVVVCARCHSLRHYGRVKNPSAERLLPDFDFDRALAPKMLSPVGARSVVLLLTDAADFDGSLPRRLARALSVSIEGHTADWKEGKPANVPRAVLVVTKCDVLPPSVSPEWLEEWARRRVHERGVSMRLAGVHLVSSVKEWGVRNLVEHVQELVGKRGNVWAVGAQNAGKSTLINAMGKYAGSDGRAGQLTEAPVPGTTLGIVKVEGVLGGQAKLYDTPGVLHPHQITTRLTRDELKLVQMGKSLRPRTYRIKAGYSVHLGGLMRVDVEESSAETIYLTVWASSLLPLHMGRTENASKLIDEHFGRQLQPPISQERIAELGQWTRREFRVWGNSWDATSVDIATAGLGWVAVGLKGEAVLGVWTYDGVDVVSRSSLIRERARTFEEAGFTVSKVVAQADSAYNKSKQENEKKKKKHTNKNSACSPSAAKEVDVRHDGSH